MKYIQCDKHPQTAKQINEGKVGEVQLAGYNVSTPNMGGSGGQCDSNGRIRLFNEKNEEVFNGKLSDLLLLKRKNERLVAIAKRCVHAIEQEYGKDNWRVGDIKSAIRECEEPHGQA